MGIKNPTKNVTKFINKMVLPICSADKHQQRSYLASDDAQIYSILSKM